MKLLGCHFIRGATAYEAQFGRLWIAFNRPRYVPTSGLGFINVTTRDTHEPGERYYRFWSPWVPFVRRRNEEKIGWYRR